MRTRLFELLGLSCFFLLLAGCPGTSSGDDDDAADDDDSVGDDDDAVDDDDVVDDDDAVDDDDVADDDDAAPPAQSVNNLISFYSERANDWSGESVVIPGDLNGDGFDDVVIGAPAGGLKEQGSAPGRVYIFFGEADPTWTYGTPLTDADVTYEGTPNDDLGFNVIGPGDWNDDGYDDLVIAAPQFPQGNAQAGRVWVVLGRPSGWPAGVVDISTDAIEVFPEADNSKLGFGLGAIGDVNGDGLPDWAANSPLWNANEGRIYIFFGRTDDVVSLVSAQADVRLSPGCGSCFGSVAGTTIAGLGDVDGDGIDDFAIGAPTARPEDGVPLGRTYIVYGATDLGGDIALEDGLSNVTTLVGGFVNSSLGLGLAGGDLDGDGLSEVLVGAPHNDDNPFDRGRLYIFKGTQGGFGATLDLANADWTLQGDEQLETVGYTPALGDVDNDGDLDLLLGCPEVSDLSDPSAHSGRAHVILGPPGNWSNTDPDDIAHATWRGNEYPHWVGESISAGGDVNGDGYTDVLIGANKSSAFASRAGQAYLLWGGPEADLRN